MRFLFSNCERCGGPHTSETCQVREVLPVTTIEMAWARQGGYFDMYRNYNPVGHGDTFDEMVDRARERCEAAYESGHKARLGGCHRVLANPDNDREHRSWLAGWDAADKELDDKVLKAVWES